jgi:hypothetical protein
VCSQHAPQPEVGRPDEENQRKKHVLAAASHVNAWVLFKPSGNQVASPTGVLVPLLQSVGSLSDTIPTLSAIT